jgi:hypothetical protein
MHGRRRKCARSSCVWYLSALVLRVTHAQGLLRDMVQTANRSWHMSTRIPQRGAKDLRSATQRHSEQPASTLPISSSSA